MSRKGREGFEEKEDEQVGLDVSEWIEFFYVGKKGCLVFVSRVQSRHSPGTISNKQNKKIR